MGRGGAGRGEGGGGRGGGSRGSRVQHMLGDIQG
jgi:hypothetical protein